MIFHKMRDVQPLPGWQLAVQFEDGCSRRYDVEPLFEKWPVFETLRAVPGLFDLVRVDAGGYGISWNEELDLSSEELWANGSAPPCR